MIVTLNIQNDEELRAYCKDLVRGQINGITREELREVIREEIDRKVKGMTTENFQRLTINALKEVISQILYKEFKVKNWDNNWIKPYMNEYFDSLINGKKSEELIFEIAKRLTDTK